MRSKAQSVSWHLTDYDRSSRRHLERQSKGPALLREAKRRNQRVQPLTTESIKTAGASQPDRKNNNPLNQGYGVPYKYYICDVSTNQRFGGNQLAVLPEADGLTDAQMQQIARAFNFSESTFVFSPESGNTRKVCIFTPNTEVPFAGHPNVGTAFVLASIGAFGGLGAKTDIVFEEKAGTVPIAIVNQDPVWCELKAAEPLTLGNPVSVEDFASAISLRPDDTQTDTISPALPLSAYPSLLMSSSTSRRFKELLRTSPESRSWHPKAIPLTSTSTHGHGCLHL